MIIDTEEEERYPAKEIKVGVGWQGGMIFAETDGHLIS
jgi:hypothetical protein